MGGSMRWLLMAFLGQIATRTRTIQNHLNFVFFFRQLGMLIQIPQKVMDPGQPKVSQHVKYL